MFLKTNDRIISLKNVSNININIERDRRKFRIIFNMNYPILINYKNQEKIISDYVYWDAIDEKDFDLNLDYLLQDEYFRNNFLEHENQMIYINKNEISSLKFSEKKNRVIFNLSHPVTYADLDGEYKITSEFVYVNCNDSTSFKEYVNFVKQELGVK